MVRNFTTRRAGGSETTKWSQPGSREAALRGQLGFRRFLGSPLNKIKKPLYIIER